MERVLFENGFRYDTEDNLWYDLNPKREKYLLRVGIYNDGKQCEMFKGGYGNLIGTFKSKDELISALAKTEC